LSHHVTLGDLNVVARDTGDFGNFLGFLVKDGREGGCGDGLARVLETTEAAG
jgi:hypothetical protein